VMPALFATAGLPCPSTIMRSWLKPRMFASSIYNIKNTNTTKKLSLVVFFRTDHMMRQCNSFHSLLSFEKHNRQLRYVAHPSLVEIIFAVYNILRNTGDSIHKSEV